LKLKCGIEIEISEKYTESVPFDARMYKIAFQSKINPRKFRDAGGDYYITNIRPYGILLKTE
jgi:hypothetical protein